jgi:hypothetical protein
MGYRSDVAIAFYGEPAAVDAFLALNVSEEMHKDADEVTEHTLSSKECKYVVYEMRDWKWYEGYPQVIRWETAMHASNDHPGITCEFMRVGEESGDIENEQYGDRDQLEYILSTNTEICINI